MKKILKYLLHFDHWIIVTIAMVLTALLWLLFDAMSIKNPFKQNVSGNSFMDTYYAFSDRSDLVPNADIVVVDIGHEHNRELLANCLTEIDSLKPRAIGVDIIFEHPDPDSVENAAFIHAICNISSPMVFAAVKATRGGKAEFVRSFFADSLSLICGNAAFQLDNNTIHSFQPITNDGDTAFTAKLLELWGSRNIDLKAQTTPIEFDNQFLIIPLDSIKAYSELIENGIVLVGDASSINDTYRTPIGNRSGVECHAYCLKTLHDMEHYPYQMSTFWNALIAIVLCYVLELMLSWVHTGLSHRKKTWSLFLREWIEGSFLTNIVLLPIVAIVTLVMMNEALNNWRFFNASLIFTSLIMLIESRNIYQALIKALREKHNWSFLNKSLIQN